MAELRFTDGRKVDVVDSDCEFRPCFWFGIDKGAFVPGRGYTNYHAKPRPVCFQRHLHGCPHKPAEDGIKNTCQHCGGAGTRNDEQCVVCRGAGRTTTLVLLDPNPCCANPQVAAPRGARRPMTQRCRNCGTTLRGLRLELARSSAG